MADAILGRSIREWAELVPKLAGLEPGLLRLGEAMLACWSRRGKVLMAGNGGSAADAMHFAEELVVRFVKDRRALAAIALTDPTVITCCANDYGYAQVFERQIEALGNAGDVLVILSTSGNSENLVWAAKRAKAAGMVTAGFLGKGGGKSAGVCDIELIVPSDSTARIQEAHKLLFHSLCQWIDESITD